jgi:putative tricarboxylic transport membrane protein
MELLTGLLQGFQVALTPMNLAMCVLGVVLGTVIGVMPGLGPSATIAMLLPLTFKLEPTGAMIMLAGIYYGAKYGGSTTSILLNVPGESSSVVTCIDGYQMARNGRAGPALGMAAIASFIAGTFGVVALMLVAPPLAQLSLAFSAPEYFALMVLGLAMVALLAGESLTKALLAMLVGLWIATMGTDLFSATSRFTFGRAELLGGIDFIIVAIGVFASARWWATWNPEAGRDAAGAQGLRNLLPTWDDMKRCRFAFVNGSVVGFLIGILPGAGSTIASFMSYGIEKAVSKHPEEFGRGAIEGVAAPEGANNAETGGALVPLLTLGIPGSGTTAILLAALICGASSRAALHPGQPAALLGPGRQHVHRQRPAAVAQPAARGGVRAAAQDPGLHDVSADPGRFHRRRVQRLLEHVPPGLLAAFGLLGYAMRRLDYPTAPLVLGLVLGDSMEKALRQSLMMSQGDLSILLRPIPSVLLAIAALLLAVPLFKKFNAVRIQMLDKEA